MLAGWIEQDAQSVDEQRAALVEKIEFNPANGTGRVFYRVGLNGAKFNLQTALRDLGLPQTGVSWRPHGDLLGIFPPSPRRSRSR